MKKIFLVLFFAVFGLVGSAQTVAYKDQFALVEVRGVAERRIEPNRVEVNILLSESSSKGKVRIEALEEQLAGALKQAAIDPKQQLVLVGASSAAQKRSGAYQYKNYRVTAHSASELAALFDALASTDILQASVGRMYHSNQAQIHEELQVEAMKNSQQVASTLAEAVGQSIGAAVSIQYWNSSPSPVANEEMVRVSKFSGADQAGGDLPSEVGMRLINLRVDVTVNYRLN